MQNLLPANMSGTLAETLARATGAENSAVQAQAIKDLGYFFANGFQGVSENDVFANQLYELALDISGGENIQAAHDLGYHALHGLGMAAPDYSRAFELLTQSDQGGHRLSAPMLEYMRTHNLIPSAP